MPGPPDYDGVCRKCGYDEYVCHCAAPELMGAAEYYAAVRKCNACPAIASCSEFGQCPLDADDACCGDVQAHIQHM